MEIFPSHEEKVQRIEYLPLIKNNFYILFHWKRFDVYIIFTQSNQCNDIQRYKSFDDVGQVICFSSVLIAKIYKMF